MGDLAVEQSKMRHRWAVERERAYWYEIDRADLGARAAARLARLSATREKSKAAHSAWRRDNYDKIRDRHLRRLCGISLVEFGAAVTAQGNKCSGCRRFFTDDIRPVPDHDHVTGNFRGALCGRCNTVIGMAGDDEAVLAGCIEYLKTFK